MDENQRTVTLPTIPKEVADAIESCREQGANNVTILEYTNIRYTSERLTALRSIPFDTLLSALVNGYVVEKSEEELAHDKIRVEYHFRMSYAHRNAIDAARADAIIFTLQTLGIKIEGVNV